MVEMELSPKSKTLKYTYLDRQKKKSRDHSDLFSASDSEMPPEPKSTSSATVNKAKKAPEKPANTAGMKNIDFKVPSPKRPETTKPLSTSHGRTPSMGSLRGIAPSSSSKASGRFPKPRASLQKELQSESEVDDDASVAESFISLTKVRRTEAERIAYFKNQPEVAELEPNRVLCTRCNKHISLGKKTTYTVRPWEKHREKCDQKVPKHIEAESESGSVKGNPIKTLAQRKLDLENDTRAETVERDRVLCKRCQTWIKGDKPYSLYNWNKHQVLCSDMPPSVRVEMAERKLRVINDPKAKEHSPRHVECKECGCIVKLTGAEYNLEKWDKHKAECVPPAAASVSGSTEATLVPPASTPASPIRGKKRMLAEEEEEVANDEERRPTNRPRDDAYEEPTQAAPSVLGWFMRPIRSFVTGFTQSIGTQN